MGYLLLPLAIASEVAATLALKFANGFTRLWPSVGVATGYVLSFVILGQVLKTLPVSFVYAVWSGIGTAAVAAIGFTILGEPVNWLKVSGIGLIIAGVIALNIGGG